MSPENQRDLGSKNDAWARLRFAVVGPLLSSPPRRGELRAALEDLAGRLWRHPVTGADRSFALSTIETWYYRARNAPRDPVGALRRATRKDFGKRTAIGEDLKGKIQEQHQAHKYWSYKLHADNVRALLEEQPALGPMPSYSTILRFMKESGLLKEKAPRVGKRPGQIRAQKRFETREVRSYEVEHVGALWHFDFHHSSLPIVTASGEWVTPILLAVADDFSRLCCHAQWYLEETAETLVHGFSQAIQKRGLARAALSDNGAPMIAEEFQIGMARLGIIHETTLPYSPYQNAKQEVFFATLEGRLMKMLEGLPDLTLAFLNEATQAWVEMEYNRSRHDEIKEAPLERFLRGPDVSRPSPSSEEIRGAFRRDVLRTQRRSDGTASLEGVRFEIPDRFRHLERLTLRHARWDLSSVHIVDSRTGAILAPIYPLDKVKNAEGRRRVRAPGPLERGSETQAPTSEVPPLLRKLLREYSATGLPPAYIPKNPEKTEKNQ